MRERLLRNFLFQAHAELEAVDESQPGVLPAQIIHDVNDCVYMLCGQTIQQTVQVLVVLQDSLTVSARRFDVRSEQCIQNRIDILRM